METTSISEWSRVGNLQFYRNDVERDPKTVEYLCIQIKSQRIPSMVVNVLLTNNCISIHLRAQPRYTSGGLPFFAPKPASFYMDRNRTVPV